MPQQRVKDEKKGSSQEDAKTGARDAVCPVCRKKIRSKYYLQFHMAVHSGEKNYVCGVCQKGYQQKWNLITHMARIHSSEKPFECSDCGKAFGYSSHFKRHVKTHFLDKIQAPDAVKKKILNPHACHPCGMRFESRYRLKVHSRTCKSQKRRPQHSRDLCDRGFHRISGHHLDAVSGIDGGSKRVESKNTTRRRDCHVCGKVVSRASIAKHLNVHFRNRVYPCRYCEKEFLESGQRTIHERKHTGEKPYSCEVCNKEHAHYSNLLTHRKRHHNLHARGPQLWKRRSDAGVKAADKTVAEFPPANTSRIAEKFRRPPLSLHK